MTENVTNNFPHVVLTSLPNERPTRLSLRLLQMEVNSNAVSVPSNRGNGALGHLAIVVSDATYQVASSNIPFIAPPHPGAAPNHNVQPTSGPIIAEINRQFIADLAEYRTYYNTEAAIKQQIIAAVPSTFINEVRDDMLGFATVSVLKILTHLHTTYGALTTDDLDTNMSNLHKDWNPTQPLEDLFEQIRKCREFAKATDPISESTAVRAIISNLEKTGLFTDAIRDWRKRPTVDHTLLNLKLDFTEADRERQRKQTTSKAGYHTSAAAITKHTPPTAPTSGSNNSTMMYYCWSHGYSSNQEHHSGNCKFPAPGHRTEATVCNMLGGCNFIRRRRNEIQVYTKPKTTPQNAAPANN